MTPSSARADTGAPTHALYDEDLRQGILAEATRRLQDAAPEKLGLRPLAASQGTSTTAIYTMFGGKAGLLWAVAHEADRRLAGALRDALRYDSVEGDMRSLCRAYRRWALDNQGLYGLVVGDPARSPGAGHARTGRTGSEPLSREPLSREPLSREPQFREPQWREPLLEIVDALVDEGIFRSADVHETATAIWASLHGVVSLELSVWRDSPSAEQYFETQLAAILRSWAAGSASAGSASTSTGTAG
ncbi:TetR-like C-terminal domain-containing protein [Rhodococcus sp. IEGM 1408]|uniref:TetR/AcrR family transcriptional regulator n=1 Tax=Rhodococcus sp. IEGM 1408 TaxID=3082220 RepID=UPI002954EB3A|nr:TetR-like C-terminal domain-containing protein [Rhodococcus sp. IEGM 1408]MDV8001991.1 TetR-like C-terminal domain-containing protein [Rhodococcus sp. IEGM 1408]